MRRASEASNKRDLLEKGRGWMGALDGSPKGEPSASEVREAWERLREWNPTDLRGHLYKQGPVEALEWLLGGRGLGSPE